MGFFDKNIFEFLFLPSKKAASQQRKQPLFNKVKDYFSV